MIKTIKVNNLREWSNHKNKTSHQDCNSGGYKQFERN